MRTLRSILFLLPCLSLFVASCSTISGEEQPRTEEQQVPQLTPLPPATSVTTTIATTPTTTIALPELPELGSGTVCDLYSTDVAQLGTIASEAVTEASGIAASSTGDAFWVVNDSGNAAEVYAIAADGTELAAIELDGVLAFDWEAIAVGPGPEPGIKYIYVGDIGDNFRLRSTISLLRFPEPDPADPPASVDATRIRLSYPDRAEDAEAMWVDPLTGDLFVVTKRQPDGRAVVFTAAAAQLSVAGAAEMTAVAEFSFPENVFVTAADVTADGAVLALRGYNEVWLWPRRDLEYVTTLAAEPCLAPSPDEIQGEALTFTDGLTYVTLSEGSAKPLNRVSPLTP